MRINIGRLAAVLRKELREYRRSPFIIGTMAVLPLVFLIEPIVTIFRLGPTRGAHPGAGLDSARVPISPARGTTQWTCHRKSWASSPQSTPDRGGRGRLRSPASPSSARASGPDCWVADPRTAA
jgi:hypothetical protein